MSYKAKGGQGATVDKMPAFLAAKNLEPFISNELIESTRPIIFRGIKGIRAFGRTQLTTAEVKKLFLQAQTKNTDFAMAKGIIHEIADVNLPAGAPLIQLVFQR